MDRRTVITKTAKGLMEITGKTSLLPRELRNVLSHVDGKATVGELHERMDKVSEAKLFTALGKLVTDGFVREFVAAPPSIMPPSLVPIVREDPDLDFSSLLSKSQSPAEVTAQTRAEAEEVALAVAQAREREKVDATAKAEAEKRVAAKAAQAQAEIEGIKREAEAKAKRDAEAQTRRAAEEKAKREAEEKSRRDAEQKAKREAEEKSKREAEEKAKREAEARARQAAEEKARREAEEKAKREAEAQARRAAEEKAKREAEEKAKREAEEKAKREAEEKAKREAEQKAKRETEEKAKRAAEEKAKREAEEQRRREAEDAARRREAEERARHEAERRAAEERAQREQKERAQREEEERIRRELEERVRQKEAQARLDAEKHEAAERARRAAEAQQRLEAEETARRKEQAERERREAEAQARRQAEEAERRRQEEERARQEAERRQREEEKARAVAEAEAAARARREERARERAEADARTEAHQKEQAKEAARVAARLARIRSGKKGGPGKSIAIGLAVLIAAGLGYLHFRPLDVSEYERLATESLGVPVKIGAGKVALFPAPALRLEKVTVGEQDNVQIAVANASPNLLAVLTGGVQLKSIELQGVTLDAAAFGNVLFSRAQSGALGVERVHATGVRLALPGANLPELEVKATVRADGGVASIVVSDAAKTINAEIQPQSGGKALVELSVARANELLALPFPIESLSATGTATASEFDMTALHAGFFDGAARGKGKLTWAGPLAFDASLEVKQLDAKRIAPVLAGRVVGSAVIAARADALNGLGARARLDGTFSVNKGVISGIDLPRVIQTGKNVPGSTNFNELSARAELGDGRLALRSVKLDAGQVSANGSIDLEGGKSLAGKLAADMKTPAGALRASLTVSGTPSQLNFKR
jgi:hypothetical protein